MRRVLALAAVCAVVMTACVQESPRDPSELLDGLEEPIAPDTGLNGDDAPTSGEVVDAALHDVDDFWRRSFEGLYGEPYTPIRGGFWPYGPTTEQPPCGDPPPDYSDIAENAFYCPSDDLIAWDDVNLIPALYDDFGGLTLGIVFAHEFGHAIQSRAGVRDATIVLELQADCFAGAWAADVEAGGSENFEITLTELDKTIAGFLELRDGIGIAASDPAAHGTGFDRIGAFGEGFEQGVERCASYPSLIASGELVVVEVPFTDPDDFERGGNLPLDELLPSLVGDLDNFWTLLFQENGQSWEPLDDVVVLDPVSDEVTCAGETFSGDVLENASFYCVPADTIYIDGANLIPALNEIGDYAVATEIARQYAYAAQVRLGNDANDLSSNLQADCLTGIYAFSGFSGNRQDQGQELFLSPGDLDEAVIAFLFDSDSSDAVEGDQVSVGTAFERVGAFRDGFVDGVGACGALSG